MKFLIVFALCVAAATARFVFPDLATQKAAEIQQIKDIINHPNTDTTTATALQQLLDEILGVKPQEDVEDIASVKPIIFNTIVPSPEVSPLVQIIINVISGSANPVFVDAFPIVQPSDVNIVDSAPIVVGPGFETVEQVPEVSPSPVIIVEGPEVDHSPVVVVEEAKVPEPIVLASVVIS